MKAAEKASLAESGGIEKGDRTDADIRHRENG